jgi:hypothetical protein
VNDVNKVAAPIRNGSCRARGSGLRLGVDLGDV